MLKVELKENEEKDSGKVFFCNSVKVYESGDSKFVEIFNKRAKVKSSLLLLKPNQTVSVSEAL